MQQGHHRALLTQLLEQKTAQSPLELPYLWLLKQSFQSHNVQETEGSQTEAPQLQLIPSTSNNLRVFITQRLSRILPLQQV